MAFVSGGFAELMAGFLWVPMDGMLNFISWLCCHNNMYKVIVQRLQIQGPSSHHRLYNGGFGTYLLKSATSPTIRSTRCVQKDRCQRGGGGSVSRILSLDAQLHARCAVRQYIFSYLLPHPTAAAVSWATYEFMKQQLYKYNIDFWVQNVWAALTTKSGKRRIEDEVRKESHIINFMAGVTGGILASVVVNPMDVAKTRLQTDTYLRDATRTWEPPLHHLPVPLGTHGEISVLTAAHQRTTVVERKYTGLLSALRLMVKEEGPGALMKGVLPRIMFFAPLAGMQYSIYELAKQLAHVSEVKLKVCTLLTYCT